VNDDSSVQAWLNGGPKPSGGDWYWVPQGTIASGVGTPGGNIRFADLNGDGKADYVKVNDDSSVQAWLNGGPKPSGGDWYWVPQGTIAGGVGAHGSRIRFAPLYGTSADYILMGGADSGDPREGGTSDPREGGVKYDSSVQVWQNGGPKPSGGDWYWVPQGTIASGVGVDGARIQFADINGDDRADYLDVDAQTGSTRAWIRIEIG
ncbi:hypothetical protein AB0K60_13090, partial [Thermopolyspora sp. NPDC052614]|uniref:hypothetical protein n=1 Tax=Thermopolyspora sp. NPDC052614 TaxID=3155682 RepID=UPI00343319B4